MKNAESTIDRNAERIDELQKEKIEGQQTVIQLKDEVVMKRSNELNKIKSTVQAELKSYLSKAKKNLPTPLTRKTIEAAVKSVCDQEDRSRNLIVQGFEENCGEVHVDRVKEVREEIDEKPVMKDCVRVGVKRSGDTHTRPVKFSLSNSDHFPKCQTITHKKGA